MSKFKVGDRVQCTDPLFNYKDKSICGRVWTVKRCFYSSFFDKNYIELEELPEEYFYTLGFVLADNAVNEQLND